MPSNVDPDAKCDVQPLVEHLQQNRQDPCIELLVHRRLSDPPYRPSHEAALSSVETRQPVLEQIKSDLERLVRQAAAIDEASLAYLIDTSRHEAENALERHRWEAETKAGVKKAPQSPKEKAAAD